MVRDRYFKTWKIEHHMENIIISALAIGGAICILVIWIVFLKVLVWSGKPKKKKHWKPTKARDFNERDFK